MGQGDYQLEYPPLHEIASSKNPIIHKLDAFLTYLNPEPHRRTFLKTFMRDQVSEYCSSCHKVHLDEPVNHYRWIRGFNEYDNWQASGVSGQGARSFYYPAKSSDCADCHMPLRDSRDPGNRGGKVHSHRFAAANTAVASVNHDDVQLKETEAFLKSGFITVDLFAASPVETNARAVEMKRRANDAPSLSSTFAVGEESEQSAPVTIREVGKIAAPLNAPGVAFAPGSTVRVDAVVRTRRIGHFFPAGTVDGYDVWLEFQARDCNGRILAWSGRVADDGRGPVDRGAHFYRSYLIDEKGNPINKRNAWQARSTFYVRLIPPGAADTVHYLVEIPKDAAGPITLEAKLNYRKFTDSYTKFAYGAVPKPGPAGISYDSREYISPDPSKVPVLPITTLATASVAVPIGDPHWQPVIRKQDRERWNDWGIGMLLQGDLKGAEYAFQRVTEAEPSYADGYVNIARALVQEGETDSARPYLEKALSLSPGLARAEFFLAMAQKASGDYDGALKTLAGVRRQYPRDRVVTDQVGRILFLQRRYAEAVHAFFDTLAVDPEDLQAHYNLMLCYRGLGQAADAEREQKLFLRFKADESAQALTAAPRLASPEDNNERQAIHDHSSERLATSVRTVGAPAGR
jgi:Flp pilus assembly protein TadD